MGVKWKIVLVTKWKFAFITIERETTLTNGITQYEGKLKKGFGNKFWISNDKLRKGEYSTRIESLNMGVKWKSVLVINSESAMITIERETTISKENPSIWG
jgi:hypothetical protein